jgi:integrase
MARPKLDPKIKKARREKAKREAEKLNKKLASHAYTYAHATEWGKVVVYYEPPGRGKVRIHAPFPSIEFDAELLAAKQGRPTQVRVAARAPSKDQARNGRYAEGTFGWLLEWYFRSDEQWPKLVDKKRREADLRKALLVPHPRFPDHLYGDCPLGHFDAGSVENLIKAKLETETVRDVMEDKDRPVTRNGEAANQRRKWLVPVLQFAVKQNLVPFNYVLSTKKVRNDRLSPDEPDGFPTWPQWLINAYREVHPHGTLARLVFELALYTTARKSDLPRLGPQFLKKDRKGRDVLVYWQHKNRNHKPVKAYQPILPQLRLALKAQEAGILGGRLYLAQKPGTTREKAYGADTIGNYMQGWVVDALKHAGQEHPPGRKGYSLHGLRKSGICMLIIAGIPDRWIMAISGHRDPRMVDTYGREYMREFGAEGAFDIWLENQKKQDFDESEFEMQECLAA